ncbi:hypothetical protein N431DRAFT_458927 [Stipitochalara longipes BDJ]|nr:hypothetical protein N431DRAFT_458927 [Stipitochalara longipes BDJ]
MAYANQYSLATSTEAHVQIRAGVLPVRMFNDDQVLLRYCSPWHAYCCQNTTSTADCCASGVGFEWNNATWINYKFVEQQDDFTFDLVSAFTTTSTPKTASTAVTTTTATSVSGTASACSSVGPTNTATCSKSSTVAIGAGLGAGLGVPLLLALAAILWLTARRKYEQPQTTVPVVSRSKAAAAQSITHLHSTTFNASSIFVNIKFTDTKNECYFIGGQLRTNANRIFVHVRSGRGRSSEVFGRLAREVEQLWYEVLGVQNSETISKRWEVGNEELHAVFIVPGLVAREKGFAIPEAGEEGPWLEQNWDTFQGRALHGDEDMKGLIEEVGRRPELRD